MALYRRIMTQPASEPTSELHITDARRREIAIEHLLFGTISFMARKHPELLDELEGSLGHLWDLADEATRDDEAVRDIARKFLKSLRSGQ